MQGAASHTIVSYRASQARKQLRPWWQRRYLDILLLIISAVGTGQLLQFSAISRSGRASFEFEATGNLSQGTLFENPLLFLLPALIILSGILLFLRFLPLLLRLLSQLLTLTNSVGLLQASRNLSRTPAFFTTPFILLTVTVSLSIYTASLARTLDFQLFDETWYRIGADLNLFTSPNPLGDQERFGFGNRGDNTADTYLFLPISEYENVPGIEEATRIGRFPAELISGQSGVLEVEFVGIDYDTFPEVAYWREDFSRYRISTLMNSLALREDGILVSERFLEENRLSVGDEVTVEVALESGRVTLTPQISGSFDLFPTWYPSTIADGANADAEIVVGRLDRLFEAAGSEFPYRIWMNTDGQLDDEALRLALLDRQIVGSNWEEPFSPVQVAQTSPARQGLFGLLSIGFVAAVLLTIVGFFLYIFFSFQRRFVEFGILRSVGLPFRRTIRLLAWELALLMGLGVAWGSLLGITVSTLFIPSLQVGRDPADLVPPYLVEIAWSSLWQVWLLFGLLYVIVLAAVAVLLRRMQLFQAIKLGESF